MRSGIEPPPAAATEVGHGSRIQTVYENLRAVWFDFETQIAFGVVPLSHIAIERRCGGIRLAYIAKRICDVAAAVAVSAVEEPARPAVLRCVRSRACPEDVAIERGWRRVRTDWWRRRRRDRNDRSRWIRRAAARRPRRVAAERCPERALWGCGRCAAHRPARRRCLCLAEGGPQTHAHDQCRQECCAHRDLPGSSDAKSIPDGYGRSMLSKRKAHLAPTSICPQLWPVQLWHSSHLFPGSSLSCLPHR